MNAEAYAGRLVSHGTLERFLDMTDETRTDDTPVWIVGITALDAYPAPASGARSASATQTGSYFAMSANDGQLISIGPLYDDSTAGGSPSYAALLALSNASISIVTPSAEPTYGVPPDHTSDDA